MFLQQYCMYLMVNFEIMDYIPLEASPSQWAHVTGVVCVLLLFIFDLYLIKLLLQVKAILCNCLNDFMWQVSLSHTVFLATE